MYIEPYTFNWFRHSRASQPTSNKNKQNRHRRRERNKPQQRHPPIYHKIRRTEKLSCRKIMSTKKKLKKCFPFSLLLTHVFLSLSLCVVSFPLFPFIISSVSLSSLDSEEQESLRAAEILHNRSNRNSTGGISTHSLNEFELAVWTFFTQHFLTLLQFAHKTHKFFFFAISFLKRKKIHSNSISFNFILRIFVRCNSIRRQHFLISLYIFSLFIFSQIPPPPPRPYFHPCDYLLNLQLKNYYKTTDM